MKACSWTSGCTQEISSQAELCDYHVKVSAGLLSDSGEAGKFVARRILRRQEAAQGRGGGRQDLPS